MPSDVCITLDIPEGSGFTYVFYVFLVDLNRKLITTYFGLETLLQVTFLIRKIPCRNYLLLYRMMEANIYVFLFSPEVRGLEVL